MMLSSSPRSLTTVVQFEAKEPIDRGFAACREVFKHFVLNNPAIVADFQGGGIHKADAATLAKT